jgi:hypothetical protein
MAKWRLVIRTLPWVMLVLVLVYIRQYVVGVRSLVEFGDIGSVLTGAALIVGFMLAGVVGDYKESEKLPGELATSMEAFDDAIVAGSRGGAKRFDAGAFRIRYGEITNVIENWFMNKGTVTACFQALHGMSALIADLEDAGLGAVFVSRCIAEQHAVRRTVTRIDVIRRTQFIQTGYALLQMFVYTSIALLIFASFKDWIVQFLVVGTLSLIYLYLLRLIRDLDDPFEYAGGYREGTSADVSPHPVVEFCERFRAALAAEVGTRPA